MLAARAVHWDDSLTVDLRATNKFYSRRGFLAGAESAVAASSKEAQRQCGQKQPMFGHSVIVITSILAAGRFARKNLRNMDLAETLTACGILLASEDRLCTNNPAGRMLK
jgi:hypothetical protein